MEKKPDADPAPAQPAPAEASRVTPAISAENTTTAFDPSSQPEATSASPHSATEPPTQEPGRFVPLPDKSLAFLQPASRPGSLGRLGHYEVLEVLGHGGFGIVLKAHDDRLERLVAIKVLGPQLARNATARSRFVREARAGAAVNNKFVVSTYAVDEHPVPHLVMEYVAGQTLQDRIDRLGALDTRDILRLGAEIAEGLAAAHQQGLIHRDIKPANILLEEKDSVGRQHDERNDADSPTALFTLPSASFPRVKIADFGLARAVDDSSLTQSGVIAGTPKYMSPEQARGETLDHRSDLFSLGSVLYTMCTGQPPFRADRTLGVLKRVCDDPPQPIREVNANIPKSLAALVMKLLVKDPAGRFQSAETVAELLQKHLAHFDDPALPFPSGEFPGVEPTVRLTAPGRRSRNRSRRWRWVAAAVVLLPVLALGITEATGVTQLFRGRTTQQAGDTTPGTKPETVSPPVTPSTEPPKPKDPQPAVDHTPDRNPLNNAKAGDWAEFKVTNQNGDGPTIEARIKMEVTSKTETTARIRETFILFGQPGIGPERHIDLTKPYDPTNLPSLPREVDAKLETLGTGKETLKLGGKDYECAWTHSRLTVKSKGNEFEITTKCWLSRTAPLGGLVKMEQTMLGTGGPMKVERRLTLELLGSGHTLSPHEARLAAARGDWRAAAAEYARIFAVQPIEDGEHGFEYATVLVLAGDEAGYRKLCADLLERAGRPGMRPYHVARACTLTPDSVADIAVPAMKADDELQRNGRMFWSLTEQGALAYRAGRDDDAAALLKQSVEIDDRPDRVVLNWLWLSMVERRRGNPAEARAWLDQATKWLEKYPKFAEVPDDAKGIHLHNWLEAQVLHREAERVNRLELAPPPREKR